VVSKLIICIVHPEDVQDLVEVLNKAAFRVTRMSTSGGFLRRGNVSLLIGVQEEQVDEVMEIVRAHTHSRARKGWWARPGDHREDAAIVFVMDMEQTNLAYSDTP